MDINSIIREEFLLYEGYEEERELNLLVEGIIDYFAERNSYHIIDDIISKGESYPNIEFDYDREGILYMLNDFLRYERLVSFIRYGGIYVQFARGMKSKGYYINKRKTIYLNYDINENEFLRLIEHGISVFKKNGIDVLNRAQKFYLLKQAIEMVFSETILHELRHAYDDFRSGGKFISDKKSIKYYTKKKNKTQSNEDEMTEKDWREYYNLPHEYWARFSTYLRKVRNINYNSITFNDLYNNFKDFFVGYDVLNNKDKKRLINALYKHWGDMRDSKK